MNPEDDTHFDQTVRRLKNRPRIAILLLVGVGVVALGQVTGAIDSILSFYSRHINREVSEHEASPSAAAQSTDPSHIAGTDTPNSTDEDSQGSPSDVVASNSELQSEPSAPPSLSSSVPEKEPVYAATPSSPESEFGKPLETEAYRLTAEEVRRSGNTLRVTMILEAIADSDLTFDAQGWYLLDENGEQWTELRPDAASVRHQLRAGLQVPFQREVRLLSGTKVKGSLIFSTAGSGQGTKFTLMGTERRPQAEREIVLRLKADGG